MKDPKTSSTAEIPVAAEMIKAAPAMGWEPFLMWSSNCLTWPGGSRPAEAVIQAVRDQFAIGQKLPPTVKWELLADTAHNRGAEGDAWLRLAIEVYDRLASAGDGWRQKECRRSSMLSRATLIAKLGPDENDPHRSPAVIERWFFEFLPCSAAELSRLHQEAEEGDGKLMGPVLELKGNLSVVRLLSSKVRFSRQAEIDELLQIEKLLA